MTKNKTSRISLRNPRFCNPLPLQQAQPHYNSNTDMCAVLMNHIYFLNVKYSKYNLCSMSFLRQYVEQHSIKAYD